MAIAERSARNFYRAGLALLAFAAACSAERTALPGSPTIAAATPAAAHTTAAESLPPVARDTPAVIAATLTPPPAVATPPPTATPAGQIGPAVFPDDVNPLTGLAVADPAVLERRPLAIKISNFPDCVRPQDGIARADVVFEHYAEGGTTRFTAVYLGRDAPRAGSVRSARLIDLEIPAMYQTMFGFSGASGGVKQRLENSDFFERVISPDFEPGHPAFFRKPIDAIACDLLEHTLFTSTDRLWDATAERGLNTRTAIPGSVFNDAVPVGGQSATDITLRYVGSFVFWGYNAATGTYTRSNNGAVHTDGLDGQPVAAANVVALFANHVTTDILEDFVGYNRDTGAGGNYSVEIQIWGEGRAMLFRDGQVFDLHWARWERNRPPVFTDDAGTIVPFKPGVTWFQLMPLDTAIEQESVGVWKLTPPRPSPVPVFPTATGSP